MKTKRIRTMWAALRRGLHMKGDELDISSNRPVLEDMWGKKEVFPVAVVDLRPEAIDQLVLKVKDEIRRTNFHGFTTWSTSAPMDADFVQARAAIAAVLGRLPKK